jgi:putative ABC transport system permease protein
MLAAWTFRTLIGHWRRHPLNFATLLIGLAIATALWSGVQALNRQARASYDRAASVLGPHGSTVLVPARGAFVAQDVFVTLRRAGWKVSPVLEGTVRISGAAYRLVGIEPLTLPVGSRLADVRSGVSLERFLVPPGQTLVARETLADLGGIDGARPVTDRGHALPPLAQLDDMAPGLLVVDIGVAQDVLDRPRQLSRLVAVRRTETPQRSQRSPAARSSSKRPERKATSRASPTASISISRHSGSWLSSWASSSCTPRSGLHSSSGSRCCVPCGRWVCRCAR